MANRDNILYFSGQVSTLCYITNHSLFKSVKVRGGKLLGDNKQKSMDHFSSFMFGNRQPRDSKDNSDTRSNPSDDWFFGRRRKEAGSSNKDHPTPTTQNKVENFFNNVDIELLFDTYDTIVKTTEQYKPLLKGIAPFFSKFTNKFKK